MLNPQDLRGASPLEIVVAAWPLGS